jgi:hypothetical protein
MANQIILVVVLRRIEPLERRNLSDDRAREGVGLVELRDVALRDPPLLGIGIKDRRAILGAQVRSLTVQLGRIVNRGKRDLKNLSVRDLRGVEGIITDSACPVMPLLTVPYSAVRFEPPE